MNRNVHVPFLGEGQRQRCPLTRLLVKKKWVKQVNAIYAEGRLAFERVKGEPANARPEDCRLLEREQTIVWETVL